MNHILPHEPGGERFEQLVSRLLDERLSPAEEAELLEFLQDSHCQEQFLEWTRVDRELAGLMASPIADDKMVALVREDLDRLESERAAVDAGITEHKLLGAGIEEASQGSGPAGASPPLRRAPQFSRSWRSVAVWGNTAMLVVAALLAAVAPYWPISFSGRRVPAIARLENIEGNVFVVTNDQRLAARSGQEIFPGQALETGTSGLAEIVVYRDTARLTLGEQSRISELSGDRLVLSQGEVLSAEVPQRTDVEPLVVATPHGEFHVPGSTFSLTNTPNATRIEVRQGQAVQLKRASDGQVCLVETGFAGEAAAGNAPLVTQRLPPSVSSPAKTILKYNQALFSPDNRQLVASSRNDRSAKLWDVVGSEPIAKISLPQNWGISATAFSSDGIHLAVGCSHGVWVWNLPARRWVAQFPNDQGYYPHYHWLQFSPDGQRLSALQGRPDASTVRTVIWGVATGRPIFEPREIETAGQVFAVSSDGSTLAVVSGGPGKVVTLFDFPTGGIRQIVSLGESYDRDKLLSMALSPDGRMLATSAYGRITLWLLQNGKNIAELRGMKGMVQATTFSPDGTLLAASDSIPSVALWDVATATKQAVLDGFGTRVRFLAFSPDGKFLATGDGDFQQSVLKVWDVPAMAAAGPPQ